MKKRLTKRIFFASLVGVLLSFKGLSAHTGANELEATLGNFAKGCENSGGFEAMKNALNQEKTPKSNTGSVIVNEFFPVGQRSGLECMEEISGGRVVIAATTDPKRRGKDITEHPEFKKLQSECKGGGACLQFTRTKDGPGGKKIEVQSTSCAWGPEKFNEIFRKDGAKIKVSNSFKGCWIRVDHAENLVGKKP